MNDPANKSADSESVPAQPPQKTKSWVWLTGIIVVVLGGVGAAVYFTSTKAAPGDLARTARMEFRRANYKEALAAATGAFESQPGNKLAMIAGESAQKLNDLETAIMWYRRLEEDDSTEYLQSVTALSLLCFNTGRWSEAEAAFRSALKKSPNSPELNRWLGTLLNAEGRRYEAVPHFMVAVREGVGGAASGAEMLGQQNLEDLFLLANFEAPFEDVPLAKLALETVPDDPLPLLGSVQTQIVFNKYDEAEQALQKIIKSHPESLQAHAWLGRTNTERRRSFCAHLVFQGIVGSESRPTAGGGSMLLGSDTVGTQFQCCDLSVGSGVSFNWREGKGTAISKSAHTVVEVSGTGWGDVPRRANGRNA
jgi:tetratricopeptide (TPR) repeat protein